MVKLLYKTYIVSLARDVNTNRPYHPNGLETFAQPSLPYRKRDAPGRDGANVSQFNGSRKSFLREEKGNSR